MSKKLVPTSKKETIISITLSVILSTLFVAAAAQAATTIGLNINTDGSITASSTTNQLVLGISPATVTISSTAPAAARTYTLPDNATASVNFVLAPVSSTATQALFASATAGAPAFRAIALGDLPTQTGTGSIAMSTSPTFVTPTLGAATATTINGNTITTGTGTLTLAAGSSLVTAGAFSNTLTTTAATNVTLPTTGTLATLAGAETLSNKTFVAPALGAATATSINKVAFTAPATAATFAFGTDNTTQTFQGTDTIVGRATTDTLTNKTLTTPVISTITNTGTITLPTTTTTLAGLAVAQTFSANQTIGAGIKLVLDSGTCASTAAACTLNKQAGIITSESLVTAAAGTWPLVLTNSLISASSNIIAQATWGTATGGTPLVTKITPGAGSATIVVTNISAGTALNGTILLSFTLLN